MKKEDLLEMFKYNQFKVRESAKLVLMSFLRYAF